MCLVYSLQLFNENIHFIIFIYTDSSTDKIDQKEILYFSLSFQKERDFVGN